jgi:hydroxyacylglutathione hydrolase
MLIETRAVAPFYKNGFILGCEETREGVIIDPGDEAADLLSVVRRDGLLIRYILLTHAHVDHVSGVASVKDVTGAQVCLHAGDRPLYEGVMDQARFFGLSVQPPPPLDFLYEEGGVLHFGRYEARVHHTPGHSPGGVCLQVGPAGEPGKRLFVGDTLFAGSIGRTDLPGGDYPTLLRSIQEVIFPLGDDAEVYPGHGPRTTVGLEKRTNPFLTGEI